MLTASEFHTAVGDVKQVYNELRRAVAVLSDMENIDEVWKKASERFPTSTTAWLKNFAGDLSRAKRAIVDALRMRGNKRRESKKS